MAKNTHFIRYLLLYIDSANTSYAVTRWSGPQLRELQGFNKRKGYFALLNFCLMQVTWKGDTNVLKLSPMPLFLNKPTK